MEPLGHDGEEDDVEMINLLEDDTDVEMQEESSSVMEVDHFDPVTENESITDRTILPPRLARLQATGTDNDTEPPERETTSSPNEGYTPARDASPDHPAGSQDQQQQQNSVEFTPILNFNELLAKVLFFFLFCLRKLYCKKLCHYIKIRLLFSRPRISFSMGKCEQTRLRESC